MAKVIEIELTEEEVEWLDREVAYLEQSRRAFLLRAIEEAAARRQGDEERRRWRADIERSYRDDPEDAEEVAAMGRLGREMILRATPGEDWSHLA